MNDQQQQPIADRSRADRVRRLVLEFRHRQRAGEVLSDETFLQAHPDIRDELSRELHKLQLIGAAYQQVECVDSPSTAASEPHATVGEINIRCPVCHTPQQVDPDLCSDGHTTTCPACGDTFKVTPGRWTPALAGHTIDRFQLLEHVGSGGFGTVWRAHDTRLDRIVAVKIPRHQHLTPEEADQFLREARTSAQLRHPHIVTVYEAGRDGDTFYLVSDFIDGQPLSTFQRQHPLTARSAAALCEKIARALVYAHSMGVIHRDIKPHNILVDVAGEPFVTDFGLARRADVDLTVTIDGAILGTPAYMSPEQARGDSHASDERSDVYSLGVILFELLTSEPPFRGSVPNVMRQVIEDLPPAPRRLNSKIPRDLETICLKCLEKNPARRYASAAELQADLTRWRCHEPIVARPLGPWGRLWRWSARKPAIAALSAATMTAILAGVAGVCWQWRAAETALVAATAAKIRADKNKKNAWAVVDEFLTDASLIDLQDEAQTDKVREKLLAKAAEYLQNIARDNPDDPEARLQAALALRTLAQQRAAHHQMQPAISDVDHALDILRSLQEAAEIPPDELTFEIARSHLQRGRIISWNVQAPTDPDGFADFEMAESLLDGLAERDPDSERIRWSQADVALNLAVAYLLRQRPGAVDQYKIAVRRWQAMADDHADQIDSPYDRAAILENLASALLGLSSAANVAGDVQTAIARAEQATGILQEALELKPESVRLRDTYIRNLTAVGHATMSAGRSDESIEAWKEALRLRTEMARDFPEVTRHRLSQAIAASGLAYALTQAGRGDEAIEYIAQAIDVREELLAAQPESGELRIELMRSRFQMAEALADSEDYPAAMEQYVRTIELARQEPPSSTTEVVAGLAMNALVRCFRETNAPDERQKWAVAAEQHWREADAKFQDIDTRLGLAESLRQLLQLQRQLDQFIAAKATLPRVLAAADQLEADFGTQPAANATLGNCHLEAGTTLLASGNTEAALEHLQRAESHFEQGADLVSADAKAVLVEQLQACRQALDRTVD